MHISTTSQSCILVVNICMCYELQLLVTMNTSHRRTLLQCSDGPPPLRIRARIEIQDLHNPPYYRDHWIGLLGHMAASVIHVRSCRWLCSAGYAKGLSSVERTLHRILGELPVVVVVLLRNPLDAVAHVARRRRVVDWDSACGYD